MVLDQIRVVGSDERARARARPEELQDVDIERPKNAQENLTEQQLRTLRTLMKQEFG
jgi:hypothetical protein